MLDRRVAARQRVADHDLVGIRGDMTGVVALMQRDAQRFQLGRHWWVDVLVGTVDLMAEFARQGGDAAHERAGDAEDMQFQAVTYRRLSMHPELMHSRPRSWRKRTRSIV